MKKIILKHWPILFIVGVWLIFSFPYLFKGLIPYPSTYLVSFFNPWTNYFGMPIKNNAMPDVISQILPWKNLTTETYKIGQWPLWNPYSFSGTPHLANFQSAVLSPLNILFFILPQIDAWTILIILQPLLAGLFTYLFLREIKIGKTGSVLGSVAFMFCGFITVWMAYGTLGYAILFLPLTLFAIERSFKTRSLWPLTLISISQAISFFSGHFQISLYAFIFSFFYICFKFVTEKSKQKAIITFIFLVISVILALPQLLPSMELYLLAPRSGMFGKGEVIPWPYLITFLAPDFLGNAVTRNDWFGHYAEWSAFVGVTPLVLALVALVLRKSKVVIFCLLISILSMLLAFQTPLLDLMINAHIPVLSTSAVSRIIVLFSFGVSIIAAVTFDSLNKLWEDKKIIKKVASVLLVLTLVVLSYWIILVKESIPFLQNVSLEKIIVAKRNFILPTILFFLTSASILFGFFIKPKRLKPLLLLAILGLTAFDMLRFVIKWMPTDPRENFYPNLEVLNFLKNNIGIDRVFGNFGMEAQVYYRLPSLEGYDPLFIKRYGEFATTALNGKLGFVHSKGSSIDKNGKNTKKILDLLGVKYILHSIGDGRNIWAFPHWEYLDEFNLVYEDEKYQILENIKRLPRAFLVYRFEVAAKDQEIIDKLFTPEFEINKSVVLEEKITLPLQESQASGTATITRYTPDEVEVKVRQDQDGILFLSDNFYPGWKVFIDGLEGKIYRANYTFRASLVPKGEHTVLFSYQPSTFKTGLITSLITLTFLLAINIHDFLRRKVKQ